MAVIDSSYFVGEREVPNISGTHPAATINLEVLNRVITVYERDYLVKLLGETLYDEFITDLGTSEAWATGLRDELRDSTLKTSPVADYCYYYWLRKTLSNTTSGGQTEQTSENSTAVSPMQKMAEAWNSCIRLTVEVIQYLNENRSSFPSTPETSVYLTRYTNTFNI